MWYETASVMHAYPVCLFAPWHCYWPGKSAWPWWKPCTCLHVRAPDKRRMPPTAALFPFSQPPVMFYPSVELSGGFCRTALVSGLALVFAEDHGADWSCPCIHQHRRPSADNMPPPESDQINEVMNFNFGNKIIYGFHSSISRLIRHINEQKRFDGTICDIY